MHTSNVIHAGDFSIRVAGAGEATPVDRFFPDYHPQDRIAVVSTDAFDGVRFTAGMFLALTTVFYDALRARSEKFYDYPQHFAVVCGDLEAARVGPAWSWLDIWPETQWIETPPTVTGALDQLFRLQINRVFWPESFSGEPGSGGLPVHVRRLLQSRLKSVCYYRPAEPTHELLIGEGAIEMVQKALDRVKGSDENASGVSAAPVELYRSILPAEFVERYAGCFQDS